MLAGENAEQANNKQPPQLSTDARERLAFAVMSLLDEDDQVLAHRGQPEAINWSRYKRGRGPLAGAVQKMVRLDEAAPAGEVAREFVGRKPEALRKAAKKWFIRKFQKVEHGEQVLFHEPATMPIRYPPPLFQTL